MALSVGDFKEVGGPGNQEGGGQTYSAFSSSDTLATMLASGYLDAFSYKLNVRDAVLLSGTDGAADLFEILSGLGNEEKKIDLQAEKQLADQQMNVLKEVRSLPVG